MAKAIEGSTYVAHLASPYYLDNKTREELIAPALDGTTNVMKACSAASIKRCVLTSSFASIRWTAKEDAPKDEVYSESHWSNPDRPEGMGDYAVSKTLAEKAAWDYQAKHGNPFELVSINPVFMLGPALADPNVVSEEFIRCILFNTEPLIKLASNGYVDIRDSAKAHLQAIKVPEARNRRFIVCNDEITKHELVEILKT